MQGKWWAEAALWNEFPDAVVPEEGCGCHLCEQKMIGVQIGAAVEVLINEAVLSGELAEVQERARTWKRSAKHWRQIARDLYAGAYGKQEEAS